MRDHSTRRATTGLCVAAVMLAAAGGVGVAHAATLTVDGGVIQSFSYPVVPEDFDHQQLPVESVPSEAGTAAATAQQPPAAEEAPSASEPAPPPDVQTEPVDDVPAQPEEAPEHTEDEPAPPADVQAEPEAPPSTPAASNG